LKKISFSGGAAQVLGTVFNNGGRPSFATWSGETIVYAAGATSGLSRVSALGGQSSAITTINVASRAFVHHWPIFLKDGSHFIYMTFEGGTGGALVLSSLMDSNSRALMSWGPSALGSTLGYMP